MRDPETLLEVMEMRSRGEHSTERMADYQTEATLILAEQVKRIADLLESIIWKPDDDQQRALIVIQPSAQG